MCVRYFIITTNKEYANAEKTFNILIKMSSFLIFKKTGIKRIIKPIIAIVIDNIWCLKILFFNIYFESKAIKNKKYNLFSNVVFPTEYKLQTEDIVIKQDINSNIKIIFILLFWEPSLYIYLTAEEGLSLNTIASYLVSFVEDLIDEIKYNSPPNK